MPLHIPSVRFERRRGATPLPGPAAPGSRRCGALCSRRGLLSAAAGLLLLLAAVTAALLWPSAPDAPSYAPAPAVPQPAQRQATPAPERRVEPQPEAPAVEPRALTLGAGQTLTAALLEIGLDAVETQRIAAALTDLVDLRALRAGQLLRVVLDESAPGPLQLQRLSFRPHIDREIVLRHDGEGYRAQARRVPHERRVVARSFAVEGSLGASAVAADVPRAVVAAIVRQLEQRVDFRRDLRAGDRVALTFERFLHPDTGEEHDGRLLSVSLELSERRLSIYRFETADGIGSFYDGEGVSIETRYARTPVVGGWLTSTYGRRRHPILDRVRMHRGLDFAAPEGAAVVAVEAGRVARASRYGGFGRYVRIDHGEGLATAYAHLARYAPGIEAGARVARGQVIGYVGDSGLATSPSLHYEVLRDGDQIDPYSLDLPPRLTLAGDQLQAFRAWQERLQEALEQDRAPDGAGAG